MFEELGGAKLMCAGSETAALVFDGGREFYLSIRLQAYGGSDLVLEPYEFFKHRDEIKKGFDEDDWEAFMVRVQQGLRNEGYVVDILGWFETGDGKIHKSAGYAEPPRQYTANDFPGSFGLRLYNVVMGNLESWIAFGVVLAIAAIAIAAFAVLY